ncbi:hypothetical protein UYSO10_1589 [Kosakonia radicincitans]|nr:hypothetical protein UYSO10_1589 [Kosakonia radicincitans]
MTDDLNAGGVACRMAATPYPAWDSAKFCRFVSRISGSAIRQK